MIDQEFAENLAWKLQMEKQKAQLAGTKSAKKIRQSWHENSAATPKK